MNTTKTLKQSILEEIQFHQERCEYQKSVAIIKAEIFAAQYYFDDDEDKCIYIYLHNLPIYHNDSTSPEFKKNINRLSSYFINEGFKWEQENRIKIKIFI